MPRMCRGTLYFPSGESVKANLKVLVSRRKFYRTRGYLLLNTLQSVPHAEKMSVWQVGRFVCEVAEHDNPDHYYQLSASDVGVIDTFEKEPEGKILAVQITHLPSSEYHEEHGLTNRPKVQRSDN